MVGTTAKSARVALVAGAAIAVILYGCSGDSRSSRVGPAQAVRSGVPLPSITPGTPPVEFGKANCDP
jgi:hypothetical protein